MSPTARSLFLLHLPANAFLLWLGYQWLGLGDATFGQLLWSLVTAILLLLLVCWLYGATFVAFRRDNTLGVAGAFGTVLGNLFPLLIMLLSALALFGLLWWWAGHTFGPAATMASWLTFHLRKPVQPVTVLRYLNVIFWILLQADIMPLFSAVAAHGWDGFGEFSWRCSSLFRLEVPLLTLCIVWLPFRVLDWAPRGTGFGVEMTTFVLQGAVAYLIFVVAVLVTASLTSRGKPLANQLKTAASR